ncbi:MAG: hypothetical protein K9G41_03575 [Flavobacteriales bacterium]|nr:hypothetical protein [Flavobacteriales bacterium]
MAIDNTLNFNFTTAQQDAIKAGFDAILVVLNDSSVPYVNLTRDERKLPSIDATRMPYVHDAIDNILPLFPDLQSISIKLPRATTLFDLVSFVETVKPLMGEIEDRIVDLGINAEHLVFKSMTDSYETAQRQEGRAPGADILRAAIAPLFAGQGSNAERPTPESGEPTNGNPSTDPTPTS